MDSSLRGLDLAAQFVECTLSWGEQNGTVWADALGNAEATV